MTERRVVVEADLRIECVHLTGRLQDQRVDLREVAVTLREAVIELDEDVCHSIECTIGDLRLDGGLARTRRAQPIDRIDVQLDDRGRILGRHFLDLDSTLCGQHEEVLLGGAIECEGRVVLLGNVGSVFDPHALDDVTLDVHAEDVSCMQAHLVCIRRELDATCLAATADLHLCLDDNRILRRLCFCDRLVDGVCDTTC